MKYVDILTIAIVCLSVTTQPAPAADSKAIDREARVGQPADIAASAYQYRADRSPQQNSPESWIGLMKYAKLPFDRPVDVDHPALEKVLCGLIWEEVRPVRRVEVRWTAGGQPGRSPMS